jgi:hypothetical protein
VINSQIGPSYLMTFALNYSYNIPLGTKVGKNLIKNLTKRILNTFETTYQILAPVLIFNLHNLVFRTVAQEQHWPLQYKMGMKNLEHTICKRF